ncbi:MAG: hypothetical protein HY033_07450 [Ignavibacteriae bacterium]|nr:hypothetical protein [Ignavibacteria bacterium]MBI3364728.1 hypothetical protein [Ignavibacteriota bacterium]
MHHTQPFRCFTLYGLFLLLVVSVPAFSQHVVVDLQDFREKEVRAIGITLANDLRVHITALGGGTKQSFWRDLFDDDNDDPRMYANGWIINADTREPVWEMTRRNTSGRTDRRRFDDDVSLKKGSYEVYFAAYGYAKNDRNSNISANIDRREHSTRNNDDDNDGWNVSNDRDLHDEFMERAKEYGITITVDENGAAAVQTFEAPRASASNVFAVQKLGDQTVVRKLLTVSRDVPVHIYAIGEGRKRDDMFDFGWIVQRDTRERVWEMTLHNTEYAGGASKNRKFDGDVTLSRGTYELVFVTDGSHSNDDWNSPPPYDPYRYGISISSRSDADAITVSEPSEEKNAIVSLTRVRNSDYVSSGFRLNADTKLRVYALGEMDNDRSLADHGWIVNAQTREHVWDMERRNTYHAGGASKNRLADEIISLPKGSYIAYYETDGSHAYDHWNADAPFDPEHWGLTIYGSGESFTPSSVSSFTEDEEGGDVIAQIIRVKDDRNLTKSFTIDRPTKVRIYALGEGQDRQMYDYGWIEDAKGGRTVWEMTYNMTDRAGGAQKNRLVNTTILLDKGEYELHYETDGSHSFNDWNADPPDDRTHWGISVYKVKE